MNYFDMDRPGPGYPPYSTQTMETWDAAGLQKSRSSGFYGDMDPRAKTSKSRHETSGVSRPKVEGGGNGCVRLETIADIFGCALTHAHV
jgi:hypothetical protein